MDAKAFDKSKLPSRHVTEGPSRAPHRSCYYAMGLMEEQIQRPFVGVDFDLFDVAEIIKRTPITVISKTLAQNLENVKFNENQRVAFPVSKAISTTGGVVKGMLDLEVETAELDKRRKPPANPYRSGVLRKYADQVGSARNGAVTDAGGKAEVVCYADI